MTTSRGGHSSEDQAANLDSGTPPRETAGLRTIDAAATLPPTPPAGITGKVPGAWGKRDRKVSAMMLAGLSALGLGLAVGTLPVPYVVESPGPALNTLGQTQGSPVIKVTGKETFPAAGNLDLTTVYVSGGPNGPVSLPAVFSAWLDPAKAVSPVELVYPEGTSREEAAEQSSVAMTTSQENALASALNELGIPFGQRLEAAGLSEGSAATGKIEPEDVLLTINGKQITSLPVIQEELAAGNGAPATVVVERDGREISQVITPAQNEAGRFVLGVLLKYQFSFPFEVEISLERVGGPSAGLMFALGIIDTVTPGDLTGGLHIAGTGTISPDGTVGPIGGIEQKMLGARAAGATLFLAPAANCEQVAGNIPEGLQVVSVENLDQAHRAVEMAGNGQDTSGLPACEAN